MKQQNFILLFAIVAIVAFVSCGDSDDVNKNGGGSSLPENTYSISNSSTSAYKFSGNGLTNELNPSLTLIKGVTYSFKINAPGHPFWIKITQGTGTGNAYSSGLTGNGTDSGTITFTVPSDAPATLYYNCQFHGLMTGTITIVSP